jgi:hypothetical protein
MILLGEMESLPEDSDRKTQSVTNGLKFWFGAGFRQFNGEVAAGCKRIADGPPAKSVRGRR